MNKFIIFAKKIYAMPLPKIPEQKQLDRNYVNALKKLFGAVTELNQQIQNNIEILKIFGGEYIGVKNESYELKEDQPIIDNIVNVNMMLSKQIDYIVEINNKYIKIIKGE